MHHNTGSPEPDRTFTWAAPVNRAAILRDVIGHGDVATQCELGRFDTGIRCIRTAVAYVEFHMVGHCQRFDCDEHGNACGFVCADHRDALEYAAQRIVTRMAPRGVRRLVRRDARCPSCGRTLLGEFDILQVVVPV
ncbi:hypothetical protein [Mycolicibacterium goodii]|uniref:Uncharacterized protein n=1 Tax=Mycolicibacterium goodii TaxID=134601 RepID=A0ABS6HVA5_MYCGD|nr:hypothetical protein [Mycolicibacterium goodii]OKH66012.1 hypothetical protein EB74_05490 [Mycobacterium sp. SWH-M5]MBU8820173.1 hypothetical protein [Mycolicibacterium goodii]MBU8826581.1 hypothetical protein [Mycolicibacterium goodii]MBU8832702.1 hypothetical protein [Mycolicibacterium goodii]MBU8840049.1 hypothetical protein [Mycolicibacterium goodii]